MGFCFSRGAVEDALCSMLFYGHSFNKERTPEQLKGEGDEICGRENIERIEQRPRNPFIASLEDLRAAQKEGLSIYAMW